MQSKSESVASVGSATPSAPPGPHGHHKLSLVAQYDDMCRFANSLITVDEQALINLVTKCEENRIAWLSTHRELLEYKNKCRQLEDQNKELVTNLKHVRFGYGKEVQTREEIIKERNQLRKQLNAIKEFILSDGTIAYQNQDTREKVLSCLNLNHLETVVEDTNESLDDLLEYDMSDEKLLNETNPRRSKRKASNEDDPLTDIRAKLANRGQDDDIHVGTSVGIDKLAPRAVFDEDFDSNTAGDASHTQNRLSAGKSSLDRYGRYQSSPHMPNMRFSGVANPRPGSLSTIYSVSSIDERKHNLHQKKAFKSVYCSPCGQAINFLGNYFCCEECRVICHTQCKTRLPLPCIPFRKPNGKSAQMRLIADFAPQTRPMIPALMYHCCNEIEKRGLYEEGIYRKCGSDKDIRELKEKIMKSKTGMPPLSQYDVHVLCGVVKLFLRELDEPIVTRILWRDFVRASDQENEEDERALIMQTVEELPSANRDSLAFLMKHLMKLAKADGNQMDSRNFAKIFGPTIVGHSMVDPPMTEILAENPKQIKVMEALFRIPEEHWSGLIMATHSYETNRFNSPDRRMPSSGRLLGTIQRGTLTPLKSSAKSKGALTLKPLF